MAPAHAGDGSWAWPLDRPAALSGEFDAPDTPYSAGHRGVDLPGWAGDEVRAVAAGVVTFAGPVAGIGVVTIDHGDERSTYQPVKASLSVGAAVETGDVIGTLATIGSHCAGACLHLGRLAGDVYLNPMDRLSSQSTIRLIDPDGPVPVPPVGPSGQGVLQRPLAGPVTSRYGIRRHPVTGERKLHDGVDFAAPCGTGVRAAAPGVVRRVGRSGAYGNHVVIAHAGGMTTMYGHLARSRVDVGQPVDVSTMIGTVGSTGLSTGCHLHLGAAIDGVSTDPLQLL
jgi:murein DD-endopeptidase MepM/ murein hydrolase activator NlpD